MQSVNQTFFRIRLLREFLKEISTVKEKLMEELVVNATDPVIRMRRFRMIRQLCQFEYQTVKKIIDLETDDSLVFLRENSLFSDIRFVSSRSV